jgi:hypothetical protein
MYLHLEFHVIDMDVVDIILRYPWLELVVMVNINVKKNFMKIWYKKKRITLQDISLMSNKGPRWHMKKSL